MHIFTCCSLSFVHLYIVACVGVATTITLCNCEIYANMSVMYVCVYIQVDCSICNYAFKKARAFVKMCMCVRLCLFAAMSLSCFAYFPTL